MFNPDNQPQPAPQTPLIRPIAEPQPQIDETRYQEFTFNEAAIRVILAERGFDVPDGAKFEVFIKPDESNTGAGTLVVRINSKHQLPPTAVALFGP